jgi:hypothetical protein
VCKFVRIGTGVLYRVGRDSSVGIANRYGLDGPGIESLPISGAKRSRTRVCGRLIVGISGSNSAGGMIVRVVCCKYRQKAKHRRIKAKTQVRTKYRVQENTKQILVGAKFSTPGHTGPGAHLTSCTGYRISFSGVKRQQRGVNHSTPSSFEVKQRVELYLYSSSGSSCPVLGRTFYLLYVGSGNKCRDVMGRVLHVVLHLYVKVAIKHVHFTYVVQ